MDNGVNGELSVPFLWDPATIPLQGHTVINGDHGFVGHMPVDTMGDNILDGAALDLLTQNAGFWDNVSSLLVRKSTCD